MYLRLIIAVLFSVWWSTSECKSVVKRAEVVELFENNEPIIGVLSLEVSPAIKRNFPGNQESYIAASYIKFVEGAGARAVPIWIGKEREYYENLMNKINGVLLPGGATWFNETGGYADAGRIIYDIAVDMNKNGVYMPVWGTCLGFELMLYVDKNNQEHRESCSSQGQIIPLELKKVARTDSKLFSNASSDVLSILSTKNVTYNWHMFCTTEKTFRKLGYDRDWTVLSTNKDYNGFEFISSVEHKRYPFYGIQFHPEKNIYEWGVSRVYPHSPEAILISQYFADFFVSECRKNPNKFANETEMMDSLIQNYSPTFTGKGKSSFYQMYFFPMNPEEPVKLFTKQSGASVTVPSLLLITIVTNFLLIDI